MYVIGTAGHVDHGKSTLVKTLTGIDPDRWEEERRREMTIDLGFAWLTLPGGKQVSLVDVPGHERFIKNMLAGVGGIDAALLIVAADEAIMPQTAEHIAILDLLNLRHGIIVLTKTDLVEPDWLELVQEDVRAYVQGSVLADAPIVPISARTGAGLQQLLAALDTLLQGVPSRADSTGAPRLPIDRSFTIGGFGAVVTGTLAGGPLRVGDEVDVLPQGLRARVRGLQTHNTRQETALPGSRVAVNLAGVSHHDMRRGNVLTRPGALAPTTLIDVQVRTVTDSDRLLEQNMPLDLFVGAAEVSCHITVLDRETIGPGEEGWLQLRLDAPIAVARGDRYILRQASPSKTLGGGVIVDAHPPRHRRFRTDVIASLEALARGTPADLLRRALADNLPHPWNDVVRKSGLSESLAHEALESVLAADGVLALGDGPTPALVTASGWHTLREKVLTAVRGYHRRYPLRAGIPREDLRSRLKLGPAALDATLGALVASGDLRTSDTQVWQADFRPTLDANQQRVVDRMLRQFRETPYTPPAPDLEPEVLNWAYEQGRIIKVTDDVAFLPETYAELLAWVRAWLHEHGTLTVIQFRDRFSASRKYALAFLEHLDERKITRRDGDARVAY